MTLTIGNHVLRAQSPQMARHVQVFYAGLDRNLRAVEEQKKSGAAKINDALAVMTAANYHFHFGSFPAELLQGFSPSSRLSVFIDSCRAQPIVDGRTQIPLPAHKGVTGSYQLQAHFNPLRALRPTGKASQLNLPIGQPFSADDFNFTKTDPLETFFEGVFSRRFNYRPFSLLYNLIPFGVGHTLFVPDILAGLNQYIDQPDKLAMAWELLSMLGDQTVWAGYNSLGAYASMNQYHWQIICETIEWRPPIAQQTDQASQGTSTPFNWPLKNTRIFKGAKEQVLDSAFTFIQQLNELALTQPNEYAYNIWLRVRNNGQDGDLVVLPRRHQSTQVDVVNGPFGQYTTGMAFFEIGGNIIIPKETAYAHVTENDFSHLFGKLSLPECVLVPA